MNLPQLLLDIDGTLYDGDRPIAGADTTIAYLRRQGVPFLLVTNTSRMTLAEVEARLGVAGIAAAPGEVFAVPQAACAYLQGKRPGGRCFVLAAAHIEHALTAAGLQIVDQEQAVDFVVLGQYQWIDFGQLDIAQRLIRAGAEPVALHRDLTYPDDGILRISLGAVVAALEAVTEVPVRVIGKPNPAFFQLALHHAGFQRARTIMVGDSFAGDIEGAAAAGLRAIQVRTGNFQPADSTRGTASAVLASIAELPAWLEAHELGQS